MKLENRTESEMIIRVEHAEMRFTPDGRSLVSIWAYDMPSIMIQRWTEDDDEVERIIAMSDKEAAIILAGKMRIYTFKNPATGGVTRRNLFTVSSWKPAE